MSSVILTTPVIVVLSSAALLITVGARFVKNKNISAAAYILGFLCVVGCVIYSLLLGAELYELLCYVLIFAIVGITAFIPLPEAKSEHETGVETSSNNDSPAVQNDKVSQAEIDVQTAVNADTDGAAGEGGQNEL